MKLYTLITVYHHDKNDPSNPLIKVHMTTTEPSLGEAEFKALVAREVAEGFDVIKKTGSQVDLSDGESLLTIHLNLTMENGSFTFGRRQW